VKPTGIIEEFWVKDIVDLTWEIIRLRKLRAGLLSNEFFKVLIEILEKYEFETETSESAFPADDLAREWIAGNVAAKARVEEVLSYEHTTIDGVRARALMARLAEIERIDQLDAGIERRRNAVLREIDQRRSVFSRALCDKVHEIEDVEFETIETEMAAPKTAGKKDAA
jgi:hypothetical protein